MTPEMRVLCVVAVIAACSSPKPASTVTVTITPPPLDPPAPVLRLPGDVVPIRYALELTVVPAQPTASGTISIATEVLEPTRIVWLNATELTIGNATLDGKTARVIAGGEDFIGLTVDREIAEGPLAVEVAFTARIDKATSRGIYSAREPGEGDDNEYAYTFFAPIDARRAFPCFDEPSAKVPWKVTLHVKDDHVALANAPVENEVAAP